MKLIYASERIYTKYIILGKHNNIYMIKSATGTSKEGSLIGADLYRMARKEMEAVLRKSFLTDFIPHAFHIFSESVRIGHSYASIKHLTYVHMNHAGRSGFSRIISFPSYAVQTNIGNFRQGRQDVTGYNDNGRPFLLCDPRVPKIQCFSFTSRIYDISLSLI